MARLSLISGYCTDHFASAHFFCCGNFVGQMDLDFSRVFLSRSQDKYLGMSFSWSQNKFAIYN